jgi:hypothetical protein
MVGLAIAVAALHETRTLQNISESVRTPASELLDTGLASK